MNNNQCKEPRSDSVDPVWDEDGSIASTACREDCSEDDGTVGVLESLLVGQSLTVGWVEDGSWLAVEDVVPCTCCGEALTELRVALSDPTNNRCPCCGDPPQA